MPFVRFMLASYNELQEEKAWRAYVADSIQLIGQGKYITKRYSELIEDAKEDKPRNEYENLTGDEIAQKIIEKAGLKVR